MSEIEEEVGKFKKKQVTALQDLIDGKVDEIPESDISIQTDTHIIQMEYIDPEDSKKKTVIKTGCYTIDETAAGIALSKFTLKKYDLLESIDNTSAILNESSKFFNKLEIYKKLGKEPKRSILLCSPPGVGKTAAINKVCEGYLKDDDTAVLIWDTSAVRSSSVSRFFLNNSKFAKKVKRLILIMEDIGGGSVEDHHGPRGADSSLLNLLDGVGTPFQGVPTFIIATTNNPEQSVGALIDRPGRFDKVIEMKTPTQEECEKLLEFISKGHGEEGKEDDLKAAAKLAAKEEFSIAHLQEIVVRSMIDDIPMEEVAKQLQVHKKRFKDGFYDKRSMGLGK